MIRGAETLTWACGPRWTPRQTPRRRDARPSPPSPPLPAGATLPTKTGLAERGRERELLKHWGIPSEGTPGENTICKCFLWPGYVAQPAPHRGRMLIYEILEPSLPQISFVNLQSFAFSVSFCFFLKRRGSPTGLNLSRRSCIWTPNRTCEVTFIQKCGRNRIPVDANLRCVEIFLRNTLEHKWV